MILLHEDEGNGISNVGILVMNGHLDDRTGYDKGPTTEEGLNWVMPPGPPTVTWTWADFTGRVAMRPSNAESAKSLDDTIGG